MMSGFRPGVMVMAMTMGSSFSSTRKPPTFSRLGRFFFTPPLPKYSTGDSLTLSKALGLRVKIFLAQSPLITLLPKATNTPGRPLAATEKASSRLLRASLFVMLSGTWAPVSTTGFPRLMSI